MRALVQRVTHADVRIVDNTPAADAEPVRSIGRGFVILLGVGKDDGREQADKLWRKISRMRIFADEDGKTNKALADVDGQVMVVSQFTLYANCKKGNRPSFTQAGAPDTANELYRYFVELARADVPRVATGEFGADMRIELENDGPFTIWLDTDEL
jgi:D-tyrosyl-tRNA(Tyr) deacylase